MLKRHVIPANVLCLFLLLILLEQILSEQEIHNDQLQWSCQDWIMEALESLNVEGEVGDYEYGEAKETLEADYSHF